MSSPSDKKCSRYLLSKICAPGKVDQSSPKSLKTCHAPTPSNIDKFGHSLTIMCKISKNMPPSSPNSGNTCPLARPLTMPNFVTLRQKVSDTDICCRKFVLPKKWTKGHQNPLRPATHQCPSSYQISLLMAKPCTRKSLLIFLHPSLFWRPREIPWAKVHQSGR